MLDGLLAARIRDSMRKRLADSAIGLIITLGFIAGTAVADDTFESASSVERIQAQMRRLPSDDIWWTVTGQDMGWNFRNLHTIFPTVNVYRDGPIRALRHRPMEEIGEFIVDTPEGPMRFDDFIVSDQSTTMGVVILHKGDIVYERYPRMQAYERPVYWSVAKAIVGTLVRILEERGEIDVSRPIDDYISRLAGSSFSGIAVRHILDMATGLDCAEEYTDKAACYYRYSMAIGDGFRTGDAPDNPYDYVATLDVARVDPPGHKYVYSGINTFVLAWLVEEVTDMPLQDVVTREIWQHIGAESDAAFFAPRYGIPVSHGGFLSRMRDMARFGLLFTPSYSVVADRRIISDAHIDLLRNGGNPALFRNASGSYADDRGIRHNVYQWDEIYENDNFFKGGWAGQGLLINPSRDTVAVFTSYFKDDEGSEVSLEQAVFAVMDGVFGEADD
jgi:CubicO group peptidase (beta-lactamase class C family)